MLQVSTDVRRSECVCCACGVWCAVSYTTDKAWRVQVVVKNVIKSSHLTPPPSPNSIFKTQHKNITPHSIIIIHFEQNLFIFNVDYSPNQVRLVVNSEQQLYIHKDINTNL
jgi:hypothetical protein